MNVLIKNIGTLISGDIANPLLGADSIYIEDGLIAEVGQGLTRAAEKVIDCQGATVAPGLFDTHCHVVLGDFTPRQSQLNFIDSAHHGGVTSFISAGEVHLPGRPTDPAGAKALATLAYKSFQKLRPGGAKVLAGALILEKGLKEEDFKELAAEGLCLVGEIGLGSVKTPEDAAPMVAWAKKYGFKVMMHTGGTSIPGSSTVTAEQVMAIDPDIVSHINGGPTAVSPDEIRKLVAQTNYWLELVHCGNNVAANIALEEGKKSNALHRFIIGNDAPSGTGVVSLGILRMITHVASLGGVDAPTAMCMATGNPAKAFGLNRGHIAKGREADLVVMDAPMGSYGRDAMSAMACGDIPGVALVLVDGKITVNTSRNTPPAARKPVLG
ncbi:amidohydrolase family protein [Deltaproteobacteria bacterium OttesenSCG-928-K17]|nr:amidohydrolase family protein [Deltaproteobacteria bacterium OttesenSCG-928-K17]